MRGDLRPYQQLAFEQTLRATNKYDRNLVVMPTGSGKSRMFCAWAEKFLPGRTLVLAHRENLIDQACEEVYSTIGIEPGREQAQHKADLKNAVVVASVQSMQGSRLEQWPKNHFSLVVPDEAHRCLSDQYQSVLSHFDQTAKVIGVTATPSRGDNRSLGQYFQNIAVQITLRELIEAGWLCPVKVKAIPIPIDISDVPIIAGDLHPGRLHDALTPRLKAIAESIKANAAGRKILAFLPLRETSRQFAQICNSIGLKAHHLSGDSRDKKMVLKHFQNCPGEMVTNALLLSEGYNNPRLDCVVPLRPQRAGTGTPLLAQMIGRGTRICEGKDDLLILDYLWHHRSHRLARPASLVTDDDEIAEIATQNSVDAAGTVLDLLEMEETATAQRRRTLEEQLRANERRRERYISPLEFNLALGDISGADYQPVMPWEYAPITDKQRSLLEKFKIDTRKVATKGEASRLIGKVMPRVTGKLATPTQLKYLRSMGHPSPEKATFKEATAFLSQVWGKR